MLRVHTEAYFDFVYPMTTHGFLHRGSVLEDLDKERAPLVLLKAIAVSAAPFVSREASNTKAIAKWSDEVDAYIMKNLGSFSLLYFQVVLLWTSYHHFNGNLGKTWMLMSLAARLAYTLQTSVDARSGSFSEIECQKRMMWSIIIQDRLLAGTVGEFLLCANLSDSLKLPCDEHFYLTERAVETNTLAEFKRGTLTASLGGLAILIGVLDLLREIHLYVVSSWFRIRRVGSPDFDFLWTGS